LIKDLVAIDNLDSSLERLDVVEWVLSEVLRQLLVEGIKQTHVESEEMVPSESIILKLLSVNENIIFLGLLEEMHEFQLSLGERVLLVVGLQLSVQQILVSVIDLLTFEVHL